MTNEPIHTKSNLSTLDKSILEVKNNSFNYLYQTQLDMALCRRFDFDVSEITPAHATLGEEKLLVTKFLLRIDKGFIANETRALYRTDRDVFDKVLTTETITKRSDIFHQNVLIFINGKLVTTPKVYCRDEFTNIIFHMYDPLTFVDPNPRFNYIKDLMDKGGTITVWFVPNYEFIHGNTSRTVVRKNGGIPLNHASLTNVNSSKFKNDIPYLTFVSKKSGIDARRLVESTTDIDKRLQMVGQEVIGDNVRISMIALGHVAKTIDLKPSEDIFQLEKRAMPTPFENIIIFTKESDGTLLYSHTIEVQMFFPNIYKIINNDSKKSLKLFIMYKDDKVSQLNFRDTVSVYEKLGGNLLESHKNNKVIDPIKNYTIPTHRYGIEDYVDSDENRMPIKYRQAKFRELFKDDEMHITRYLKKLIKSNGNYQFIDLSKVDLSKKLRYDDTAEGGDTTFGEPKYLFIFPFKNEDEYKTKKYLLDGVLTQASHRFINENHEFVYFNASDLKNDSIIDIEKFMTVEKHWVHTFKSLEDYLYIDLESSDEIAYLDNLFIIDPVTQEFISRDRYQVKFIDYVGEYISRDLSCEMITKIRVYITDESLLNTTLRLHINHKAITKVFFNRDVERPVINGTVFNFDLTMAPDFINHLKIFHNGRLVPRSLYNTKSAFNTYGSTIKVVYNYPINFGDNVRCYYEPIERSLVDYEKLIDIRGMVDLRDIVKKSIDFKWYEIYLNGYKLTKNNIDSFTASAFAIVNIDTIKNLEIYERNLNHDDAYILNHLDKSIKSIDREIFDWMMEYERPGIDDLYPPIEDKIDDIIKPPVENEDELELEDLEKYLIDKFIKPFENQIDLEMQIFFPTLLNSELDLLMFPHVKLEHSKTLFIQPGKYV